MGRVEHEYFELEIGPDDWKKREEEEKKKRTRRRWKSRRRRAKKVANAKKSWTDGRER